MTTKIPSKVSNEEVGNTAGLSRKSFPEWIVRRLAFETPDRLTDIVSWHGHIPFAFWIVDALRPRTFVELGTLKGDSYCAFAQAIDRLKLSTACYAIATRRTDEESGRYDEEVFEELRQYHEPRYARFSRLIRSSFDEALDYFADGTIDLLHIDGLATDDTVRHHFDSWRPKLSDRAVVLIHGVNVREVDFGVWHVWNELAREYPSFVFHHSDGLGLLAAGANLVEPIECLTKCDDREAEQVRVFFSRLGNAFIAQAEASANRGALEAAESELTKRDRQDADLARELRLAQIACDNARSEHLTTESKLRETEHQNRELADQISRASDLLVQTKGELHRTLTTLEGLRAEYEGKLRSHAEAHSILQSEVHNLWNSLSWRLFRPLRNFVRQRQGHGKETEPRGLSEAEVLRTVVTIRQSLSWELTMPLRLIYRIVPRRLLFAQSRISLGQKNRPAGAEERLDASQASHQSHWDELMARGGLLPYKNKGLGNQSPVRASRNPRILFVSHEATRTGAPLILLSLLRHFAQMGRYELFVFCDAGGPLLEAFAEHAHVIDRSKHDLFDRSPTIDELIGDFETRLPLVAICNTSTVNRYAAAFKRFGIPVVTLFHELADQSVESHLREIYDASDRIVFPAEFVREAAEAKLPLPQAKGTVIPQGLLNPDFASGNRDDARRSIRREIGASADSFVVLACGTLDLRKGIDLFVDLAIRVLSKTNGQVHFVWLGADVFGLARWVRKDVSLLGIADRVHLLGEREEPAMLFQGSDVFVLTSREDPFPCVVHEAMAAGLPVVAFSGAGGAPEALAEGAGICVGYRDVDAMAAAVLDLYRDRETAERIAKSARERVSEKYSFERYYRELVGLIEDELHIPLDVEKGAVVKSDLPALTGLNRNWQEHDFFLIQQDGDFDSDFFLGMNFPLPRDESIKLFIREWATVSRKPCSGFNPKIYAEKALQSRESGVRNPFAHYIEKGKPAGPWRTPLIRSAADTKRATRLKIAVHVHVHYPELMEELLGCFTENASQCDMFITTSRKEEVDLLRQLLASYEIGDGHISIVPNRGRDIGPFLTEYKWLKRDYDIIGHLHCKKTAHLAPVIGETWRKFLWRSLVGEGYAMMDLIAKRFEDDPALGLVFPDDPNVVGWWANKEVASQLARDMKMEIDLPDAFEFPVGTMFWCRPLALRRLFELGLSWDDYPAEPLPIDGTILHAMERLLPFIVQYEGYSFAATNVTGVVR